MEGLNDELIRRAAWFEICFVLRALEGGSVPRFLGPVIHGAFGHALREASEAIPGASDVNRLCYSGEDSDGRPAFPAKARENYCLDRRGLKEGHSIKTYCIG